MSPGVFTVAAARRWKSARRRLVALSAAVTTVLAGGGAAWAEDVRGPDVSGWRHPSGAALDWAKVRGAGESFTFVKATEGVGFVSKSFSPDWRASKAAGLLRGAYHFARPSVGSAVAQADHFVTTVGGLNSPGDLPPVLDLEVNGGLTPAQLAVWTGQWLTEVQARSGRTPIIYTSPNFWATSMKNSTAFLAYPLWVARYASTPSSLVWPRWTFWQYTETGKLPGVVGAVDRNSFNGGLDQLRAMANLPTASAPKAIARTVNGTTAPTGGLVRAAAPLRPASAPRSVSSAGRVDAFARSATGALLQRTRGTNGHWGAWRSLGGHFVGNPSVTSPSAGVLVVVVRDARGQSHRRVRTAGRWAGWR